MAYVLAGGRGSRLDELTDAAPSPQSISAARPASSTSRSQTRSIPGIRRIGVATQYKAHSLIRHLQHGWNFLRPERNESFDILPASQRVSETQWYDGTADAVFQNIDIIESHGPEYMVILAGDHIYKMDYELMLQHHCDRRPTSPSPAWKCRARRRQASASWRSMPTTAIISFVEKPADPPAMPGNPDHVAGLDGRLCLPDQVPVRATAPRRRHPWLEPRFRQGHHSLAGQARQGGGASLRRSCVRSSNENEAYWRDVGTVDAYWEANIDLTDVVPQLDLYDRSWPLWTYAEILAAGQVRP